MLVTKQTAMFALLLMRFIVWQLDYGFEFQLVKIVALL